MIVQVACPSCNSTDCEVAISGIKRKHKYLYPAGTKKTSCLLCYSCGHSESRVFGKGQG